MEHPADYALVDDEGHPTAAGRTLIQALKAYTTTLEGDFGSLRTQMTEYERLWRQEADRFQSPEDREMNQYLPAFPTPEARILGNKLVRANTKERVSFRCSISAQWKQATREASQNLEKYWDGAFWMADGERYRSRRGYWQHAVAWTLTVRGLAVTIPFVRASSRQANTSAADYDGDDCPFELSTPDPYECVWLEDGTFFAHHNWRYRAAYARYPGMEYLKANERKRKEDLCDSFSTWWLDADGNVWQALIIEDCYAIAPTNQTARRKLARLPVVIDTAFGAPIEMGLSGSDALSHQAHYQGPFEAVKNAYYVTNTFNAYMMSLMRDAVRSNLILNVRGQGPSDEELRNVFRGRGALTLGPEERAQFLAPPQISESLVRWQGMLDKWKQMGGLPDSTGSGVPEGVSALFAAEVAAQGDAAAGPISDAIKRMALCTAKEFLAQHLALRRTIKVQAASNRYGPYVMTFKPEDLPRPGEYVCEAQHDPFITKDDAREWQTAVAMRTAGMSFLSIADRFTRDPSEEEHRRLDELLKMDPGVQALELAAHARTIGRADIAAYFTQKAQLLLQPKGPTNGPGGGPPTTAGPMPQLPGGVPQPTPDSMGGPMNPQQIGTQAALGQMGAAY